MAAEPIIRLEGLTVRYGPSVALDHLDLELWPGEVFGLLGPSGAGKSTTLRVLTGQVRPHSGRAIVAGRDLARAWAALKPLFGYVPDRDNHFEELSGRRNLQIFANLYAVARARVEACLDLVELSDVASLPVGGYSLGMRRKLLLARALLHHPQLLYLDEPTANLDPHSTGLVHRTLRALAAGGCTILLATHSLAEAESLCDRLAMLRRGQLVAVGPPTTNAMPPRLARCRSPSLCTRARRMRQRMIGKRSVAGHYSMDRSCSTQP
jgi:ABC-type multidrug transport system ATPase subunit